MPTPGSNQFLPFATGSGSNVLAPADYAALAALAQGFQSGIAKSKEVNTPLRQSTFVAAAMAQIIANTGVNVNDDGNLANFVNAFVTALMKSGITPNVGDSSTNVATTAFVQTALSGVVVTGSIMYYGQSSMPSGFLVANGAAISRTAYANLFSVIGTLYGSGNGTTTFNVPDLRGEFIRGWDNSRGVDSGRAFGSSQADQVMAHWHTAYTGTLAGVGFMEGPMQIPRETNNTTATTTYGGNETRPRNIALLPCIKY